MKKQLVRKLTRNYRTGRVESMIRNGTRVLRWRFAQHILPSYGTGAHRDKFQDCRRLCQTTSPVIIDGGAFEGETVDQFRQKFSNPTIYAIEANPSFVQLLSEKYETTDVEVYQFAITDSDREVQLQLTRNPTSSSLLQSTDTNIAAFGQRVEFKEEITVKGARLDSRFQTAPNILKLDLQGAELQALQGAESWLRDTDIVLLEVAFQELYDGQPSFFDVHSHLTSRGFELWSLYELVTGDTGQLSEGDALYVNGHKRSGSQM